LISRCSKYGVAYGLLTDADGETIDDATEDQHTDVLRGTDESGTDNPTQKYQRIVAIYSPKMVLPDDTTEHDSLLAAKNIRDEARDESTKPGTSRHGRSHTTLADTGHAAALLLVVEWRAVGALVEVAFEPESVSAKDAGKPVDHAPLDILTGWCR
jgi:hypothetical protein